MLAAVNTANGTGILCTILLIATIIAFIIGLAEVLGIGGFGNRLGGRFNAIVVAVILLVVYLVVC